MKRRISIAILLGYAWTILAMETVEQKETQAPAISPKIVIPPKDFLATGMIGEVYNRTDVWLTFNAKDSKGNQKFPFLMLYPSCTQYKTDSKGNPEFEKDVSGNLTTQRKCATTLFKNSFLSSSYRSDQGLFFNQLVDIPGGKTVTLVSALSDPLNQLNIVFTIQKDASGDTQNLSIETSGILKDTKNNYSIALTGTNTSTGGEGLFTQTIFNKVVEDYWDTFKSQFQAFATSDYATGSKLFDRIVIRNWFVSLTIDGTNKLVETDIYVLCDLERKSTIETTKIITQDIVGKKVEISKKKTTEDVYRLVTPIFIEISHDYLSKNHLRYEVSY